MSITSIEAFYGSFGPEIVSLVRKELNRNGTLEELLHRLGTRVPAGLDNQHKSLQYFLYQYGVSFFLHVINSDMTADEIEVEKVRRLMPRSASSGKSQTVPDSSGTGARAADSSTARRLQRADDVPLPQHSPAPSPPVNQGEEVHTPGYSGPDRRSSLPYAGQDRRSGIERRVGPTDRRSQLDVVYKNRRFGGRDRRKEIRRAEDRAKANRK